MNGSPSVLNGTNAFLNRRRLKGCAVCVARQLSLNDKGVHPASVMNGSQFVLNGTNAFLNRRRLTVVLSVLPDNCPIMTRESFAIPVNAGGARVLEGSRGSR
ncbi:hypothetical protein CEXT_15591 [Caerostris extrusa]|uniref:Uncharacterized protein n=1 Tax=Caerostris extrusa TaxID=172846 RepID=A0AAV4MDD0_CAEEX|nr:hypothetical protein CEXT_15591 [Caerostris extrusa]